MKTGERLPRFLKTLAELLESSDVEMDEENDDDQDDEQQVQRHHQQYQQQLEDQRGHDQFGGRELHVQASLLAKRLQHPERRLLRRITTSSSSDAAGEQMLKPFF